MFVSESEETREKIEGTYRSLRALSMQVVRRAAERGASILLSPESKTKRFLKSCGASPASVGREEEVRFQTGGSDEAVQPPKLSRYGMCSSCDGAGAKARASARRPTSTSPSVTGATENQQATVRLFCLTNNGRQTCPELPGLSIAAIATASPDSRSDSDSALQPEALR